MVCCCFVAVCSSQPVSARDALSLPGIDQALLSDADLRTRGFGWPDGLSSLTGDLAAPTQPLTNNAGAGAAVGITSGLSAATSDSSSSRSASLVGRFNRHSQRLLLQQLLQPAAAAAAMKEEAGQREKMGLVVLHDKQLRKRQRPAATAAAPVPAADPEDAATRGLSTPDRNIKP